MPVPDCEVRDQRVRRTRELLHGALRSTMRVQRFDEITVQELADAAGINRATFYDHYTDKFALLNAAVEGGFLQVLRERNVAFDGTCPGAAKALIMATCDYLVSSHQDQSVCRQQNAFEPLLDSALINVICRVLAEGLPKTNAIAAGWAIHGSVKEWLRITNRSTPEELARQLITLIRPLLAP